MTALSRKTEAVPSPDTIDLSRIALLLDVDGTLLDLAPTPDEVVVPSMLREIIADLIDRARGAVALVSGRRIATLRPSKYYIGRYLPSLLMRTGFESVGFRTQCINRQAPLDDTWQQSCMRTQFMEERRAPLLQRFANCFRVGGQVRGDFPFDPPMRRVLSGALA